MDSFRRSLVRLLAGNVSLSQFRAVFQVLDRPPALPLRCPSFCRPALLLAFKGEGFSVPHWPRLARTLSHFLETLPLPVSSTSLTRALGGAWGSESLDLLHALARVGVASVTKGSRGRLLFYFQECGFFCLPAEYRHGDHPRFVGGPCNDSKSFLARARNSPELIRG